MAKILLLEPDVVLAGSLAAHLANANHKVYVHYEAQAAIAEADKNRLDVVITELQLAGRSGVEFLYEFRSYPEWQATPVIVTGSVNDQSISAYTQVFDELNISNYFYKPALQTQELVAAVNNCLKVRT
jgi:DNA-binding response OmpR family regulator